MAASEDSAGTGAPSSPSKLPLLLGLLNTVAILAAVGALAYTRVLYQRPAITEDGERDRLAAEAAKPKPAPIAGYLSFDPVTVNIEPSPAKARPADGTTQQIAGKLHYVTLAFSLEIRDVADKDRVEAVKAQIMDRMLGVVGKKSFAELTSVQGRYLLRTQLIDIVNALAPSNTGESLVTNVYFTQFLAQ